MSAYRIICVTNRRLAENDFLKQLEKIASAGVDAVILREKDLDIQAYENLAEYAAKICKRHQVPLILHTYAETAERIGIRRIHLSYKDFESLNVQRRSRFDDIGVSVHSAEEAAAAWKAGASCLTAGHIFATDCKKGVLPRGLSFLEEICRSVRIPVYAIGGISPENAQSCIRAGAAGVCLMSSLMRAETPGDFLKRF